MGTPYIGDLRIFSFNFAPKGWAACNGQLVAINQNQALFAILGTTYGGNGTTTFALPNLQGSLPMHVGTGFALGQVGGEAAHTLITSEIPSHNHPVNGSSTPANLGVAAGNLWAANDSAYVATPSIPNTTMSPASIGLNSGNQAHENRPPFLTLNICIALSGVFPSRS